MNSHDPKYPVYIISKLRAEYMTTSRALARMDVPHYIAIEPQDEKSYREALERFDLKDHVTLIILPFSNHGDGPGRARNSCWDHAIGLGAERHWVMDDNIDQFYRFNYNKRFIIDSGVCFRVMEDFCDRYENIRLAGPNYLSFIPSREKRPAFIANTRIYSCLLIENAMKYRWRGRYNEDTDLSLRVLKDGDCTVQFNVFLQNKIATQVQSGGNTAEFYHKEGDVDKSKWRDGQLNPTGTINKSQMLVNMHPDVSRIVWRWGRWHHQVDYSPFKDNKLRLKPGIEIPTGQINEYGLKLVKYRDYDVLAKYKGRHDDL